MKSPHPKDRGVNFDLNLSELRDLQTNWDQMKNKTAAVAFYLSSKGDKGILERLQDPKRDAIKEGYLKGDIDDKEYKRNMEMLDDLPRNIRGLLEDVYDKRFNPPKEGTPARGRLDRLYGMQQGGS